MLDAIAELGHCAAACELEARLCPWDRAELEQRAAAYRDEQLRLLAELLQCETKAQLDGSAETAGGLQEALVTQGAGH